MRSSTFVLFAFILLFHQSSALDCRCRLGSSKRIVGGQYAPENLIPWHAALYYGRSFVCGAFVLNDNWIVTAAHCAQARLSSMYRVAVGQTSLTSVPSRYFYRVEKVINHPSYNSRRVQNGHDIALLRLSRPINFERGKVEPACLGFPNGRTRLKSDILASGFGSTSRIKIVNGRTQPGTYPMKLKYTLLYESSTNQRLIYARGKKRGEDTCNGDSGSPAQTTINGRTAVIGLVSFGLSQVTSRNTQTLCNGLTGFCRLTYEKNFIERHVNKNYCSFS